MRKSVQSNSPARTPLRSGFTMLEMLITVGIISALAALSLVGILNARKRGIEIRQRSDLALIGTALEAYKSDFGDYPRCDDDISVTDSLNIQMDRGARLLCRALLGPAPAALPTSGNYALGYVPSKNEIAPDGADGPGFRLRAGNGGKVYGPYIDATKFKLGNPAAPISATTGLPAWDSTYFTDATILDNNGNSILYYPAAAGASPNTLYVAAVKPQGSGVSNYRPVYNAFDNLQYGESVPTYPTGYILSEAQMQYILGDRNNSAATGDADPLAPSGNDQPVTTLPYLLWTAGPDGHFGFGVNPATNMPYLPPLFPGLKCDDVCNFDIPPDLKK